MNSSGAMLVIRDDSATEAVMIVEPLLANILELDLLKGHAWTDVRGRKWVCGLPSPSAPLLENAVALPPSIIINVNPASILLGECEEIVPVIALLQEEGIVFPIHSPCNSLPSMACP